MPIIQYGLLKIFNSVYKKIKNKNSTDFLSEQLVTYLKKDILLSSFSFIQQALPIEGDLDVHDLSNLSPVQIGYEWLNRQYPLPASDSMNYLVLYSLTEYLKLHQIKTWGDCIRRKRTAGFKEPPSQYFSEYSPESLNLDFQIDSQLIDIIHLQNTNINLIRFLAAGAVRILIEEINEHGDRLVKEGYLSGESFAAAKRYLNFLASTLPSGGVANEIDRKYSEIRIVLFQFLKYVKEHDGWNLLINSFSEDAQAHINRVRTNDPNAHESLANSCLPGSSERISKLCNVIGLESGDILPPPPNKEYALFFEQLFKDEEEQPNSIFAKLLINTFYGDFHWEDAQDIYLLSQDFSEGSHPLQSLILEEIKKHERELKDALIDDKASKLLKNHDSISLVLLMIEKKIGISNKIRGIIEEHIDLDVDSELRNDSFDNLSEEEKEELNESLEVYRDILERKFRTHHKKTATELRFPIKSLLKFFLNAELELPSDLKTYLLEKDVITPSFKKIIATEYDEPQCTSFGTMIDRMKELTKLPESVLLYSLMGYFGLRFNDSEQWSQFVYQSCCELVTFVLSRYTPDEIPLTEDLVDDLESTFLSEHLFSLESKVIDQWTAIEMKQRLNLPTLDFDPYDTKSNFFNDIAANLYQLESLTDDDGYPLEVESYLDMCTQDILWLLKMKSKDSCLTKLEEFSEYQIILKKALDFPNENYIESLWVAEPDLFSLSNFSRLFVKAYQQGYKKMCYHFVNVMSETADFYDTEETFESGDFIFTLVNERQIDVLKILSKLEFEFDIQLENGKHVLFEAIDEGGYDVFEVVAENLDLDVLTNCVFDGYSLVMYALIKKEFQVIDYLINKEIDLNKEYPQGSAIDIAILTKAYSVISHLIMSNVEIKAEHFFKIIEMNHPDLIRKAILAGYHLIDTEINGRSLLIYAIEMQKTEVAEVLIKKKIIPEIVDTPHQTPLMAAIETRNEKLIRLLVDKDESLNIFRSDGHSALSLSISLDSFEIFNLVLKKSSVLILNPRSSEQRSPLHECIQFNGEKGRFLDALIEAGASVNHLSSQKNALTIGIASQRLSVIGRLVVEGAILQFEKRTLKKFDELVKTNPRWAARFLTAALNGHPSAVNRVYDLLKKMIDDSIDSSFESITSKDIAFYAAYINDLDFLRSLDYTSVLLDDNQNSLLHYAVQKHAAKETIDFLAVRINSHLRNNEGKTCIEMAPASVKHWFSQKNVKKSSLVR